MKFLKEKSVQNDIEDFMKSRKITTIGVTIAVLLCIGGCIVKHKDDTKQGKTIAASSTKG